MPARNETSTVHRVEAIDDFEAGKYEEDSMIETTALERGVDRQDATHHHHHHHTMRSLQITSASASPADERDQQLRQSQHNMTILNAFQQANKLAHDHACHFIAQDAACLHKRLLEMHALHQNKNDDDDDDGMENEKDVESTSAWRTTSTEQNKRQRTRGAVSPCPLKQAPALQHARRNERMIDLLSQLQSIQSRLLDEMIACSSCADNDDSASPPLRALLP